jgi:hypothetical protein
VRQGHEILAGLERGRHRLLFLELLVASTLSPGLSLSEE